LWDKKSAQRILFERTGKYFIVNYKYINLWLQQLISKNNSHILTAKSFSMVLIRKNIFFKFPFSFQKEMSKRQADQSDSRDQNKSTAFGNGASRHVAEEKNAMGEFEDAWEDDIEQDEEVIDGDMETNEEEDGMVQEIPHLYI
jgi:hypothetical protein